MPDNPIIDMVKEASTRDSDYQKLLTLVLAIEKLQDFNNLELSTFLARMDVSTIERDYVFQRIQA